MYVIWIATDDLWPGFPDEWGLRENIDACELTKQNLSCEWSLKIHDRIAHAVDEHGFALPRRREARIKEIGDRDRNYAYNNNASLLERMQEFDYRHYH